MSYNQKRSIPITAKLQKGIKKEAVGKQTKPKERIATKGGGTTEIKRSTFEDAQNKTGYFKPMPEFKGELMKDDSGNIYGYKKHDKTFVKATNPVDVKKITKQYNYDKKLYEQTKANKKTTTKRMSTAVDK